MKPGRRIYFSERQPAPAGPIARKGLREKYATACIYAVTLPPMLLASLWWAQSDRHKHFLITLFFAVFGTTMILGSGDAYSHQMRVEHYFTRISFADFLSDLWAILTFQLTASGVKDVYNHVISYFFGGVLNLPQLYFPFVATVYGYFYAGSILHVLRHFRLSHANYVILGLVVVFLFIKGIEGLQTVRTWTGLWILVYSCLKYYETKKTRYLFLMFLPPFIHFGYFLMAIPAWLVLVFGSRPMLYSGLLIASSLTNFLPSEPIVQQISQTERGASSVSAYQVEEQRVAMEAFEQRRQETNFYNAYRSSGLQRWAPVLFVVTMVGSGIYLRGMSSYQKRIFSIGVLTLAFSNLTWFLYAIHNRTLTIAIVFLLAGYLVARLDPKTKSKFKGLPPLYQWGLHGSLLLLVPVIMFTLSVTLDRLSVFMLGMPFVAWFWPDENMSMKAFLNMLLGRG